MRKGGAPTLRVGLVVIGTGLIVGAVSTALVQLHDQAPRPEPKTCTRVYDRRDAPGSITITWDGACSRV